MKPFIRSIRLKENTSNLPIMLHDITRKYFRLPRFGRLNTRLAIVIGTILVISLTANILYSVKSTQDTAIHEVERWSVWLAETVRVSLNTLMKEEKMDARFTMFDSMRNEIPGLEKVRVIRGERVNEIFKHERETKFIPREQKTIADATRKIEELKQKLKTATDPYDRKDFKSDILGAQRDIDNAEKKINELRIPLKTDPREKPGGLMDRKVLDSGKPQFIVDGDKLQVWAPYIAQKQCGAAGGCHVGVKVGNVLGAVHMEFSLENFNKEVRKNVVVSTVGKVLLSVLIIGSLMLMVTRIILRRLGGEPDYAADVVHQVAEGNLSVQVQTRPGDTDSLLASLKVMVQKMALSSAQIRKLSRTVEQSPNTIIITDSQGIIEYVNPHFGEISGYTQEEVIGKNMRMFRSGETSAEVYEDMWRTIKSGQVWRAELLNKSKQGNLYWEEVSISPIFDEQGNITHFLSQQIDITSRKQVEEQIRLFEKVVANANEAILICDAHNRIVAVNPAFTQITGYTQEEVVGKNPQILSSGQMDADFYKKMWSSINETGKWQGEVVDRRKDGEIYAEWLSISALFDNSGRVTHYVALMSDISERKAAEEHMIYLAQHDILTGLPNRMLFQDRLQQAITYAERQRTSVALLFLDLDRFKDVNDILGHHFGDLLLQKVTQRILMCVRGSDTVSRQGGDEYVIMLPDLNDLGDIVHVVNKLIESIADPFELEGHTVHVTTSIGVSVYPQDGVDIETLIRNADTAMYQAKDAGRNSYRFFTPEMNRIIARRVGLENSLRRALNKNELLVHYQPQIDLRSGQIVAAEALVRWQYPEEGLTSTSEFIRVAEESGLIVSLGEWVLNEACRQNQEWREMGLREIIVAVNLSPLQLHDRNLMEIISGALTRSRMAPNGLELEITESAMMKDSNQAIAVLNNINRRGIKVSIDDFGTGYSSLSHLKRFPVDMLKIDQSFVRDLSIDSDDAAIVSAVISMAKSLGLRVIAEGVETVEQLRFLEMLDCDLIQGYYFSKPLPADDFRKLLESGRKLSRTV